MIVEMDKKLKRSLEIHLMKDNSTLMPSIETELDKPKENMQPEQQHDKPKEAPRAKRQNNTLSNFIPAAKMNFAKDHSSLHQNKEKTRPEFFSEGSHYVTASTPNVTFPSEQIFQTAPMNNQPRQMPNPTPMNVSIPTSFSPLQECRSSFQPLPLPEQEQPRQATPEAAFQGDFINAIDKAFFSSRVTLNPDDYMGSPWVQNEASNLTVLNPVSLQEHNLINNGAMNFPGNGNFPITYENSVPPLNIYSNSQTMAANPRPQEIPYISPTKDDFGYVPSITNIYPRYNTPNYLYEPARNVMQPNGSDVMNFNGLLNAAANSFGMDGLTVHDVQSNRLGIGAV